MTIDSRKAPVELISLFIILSPLEHVARVEQIGYVFLIGVLLLLFSKKLTLKRGSKLNSSALYVSFIGMLCMVAGEQCCSKWIYKISGLSIFDSCG